MSGVYISFPFCNQKCSFCNFASGVYTGASRLRYEEQLIQEVEQHHWEWEPETLYFGGGTPSLMSDGALRKITSAVSSARAYSPLFESTLECAPGTITPEAAECWRECGINRVSLGVQSFVDEELRKTGRRHSAAVVEKDIETLYGAGIRNINLDLIAGLPLQNRASWNFSLDWIERLNPPHVSVYIFEVDEDSRLGKEVLTGGCRYGAADLPDEDLTAELYESAVERLTRMGIERYEISNFARPGWQSRHNLKYWQLEPYIGFGLDAHSFDGKYRWSNPDTLQDYLSSAMRERSRQESDVSEERFFAGLRMTHGIEAKADEMLRFAEPIRKWRDLGLLNRDSNRLWLSPRGLLMSNEILQEFVDV